MAEKLLKQLEKVIEQQDEAKTANVIERILSIESNNVFALHCKAVLLIHQAKYEVALTALSHLASAEEKYLEDDEFHFQKGYCLYRLQRFQDARQVVSNLKSIPARHLQAQIAYNLEDYAFAAAIYEELLASNAARDDEERQEIITNLSAAYATINAKKAADAVRMADEKTVDMLFNVATAELESRQYDSALATLSKVEQLAVRQHNTAAVKTIDGFAALETLPSKSADRSLFEELSPIWVQRAYVHYVKGEEDASAAILSTILKHKVSSVAVNAVASINWAAIKRHNDFFDTHRKLKQVQTPAMLNRLTTKQKLLIKYNTAMLLLNIGKLSACKQIAESLIVEHPQSEFGPLLLLAAHVRADVGKKSAAKVEDLLSMIVTKLGGSKAVQTRFTIAQIRFEQGDIAKCLAELSQVEGIQGNIGYVMSAAEWLIRAGEAQRAVELIQASLSQLKDQQRFIIAWAGRTLMAHGEHAKAATILQLATGKKDDELVALSVLAAAHVNVKHAVEMAKQMPIPSKSSATADQLFTQLPSRSNVEAAGFKRSEEADDKNEEVVNRRSRSMRRPAKNFNKDVRPDPERWVPMVVRLSMKDLPLRRKKELKRLRASEQEDKRKAAEKRRAAAAAAAAAVAAA